MSGSLRWARQTGEHCDSPAQSSGISPFPWEGCLPSYPLILGQPGSSMGSLTLEKLILWIVIERLFWALFTIFLLLEERLWPQYDEFWAPDGGEDSEGLAKSLFLPRELKCNHNYFPRYAVHFYSAVLSDARKSCRDSTESSPVPSTSFPQATSYITGDIYQS